MEMILLLTVKATSIDKNAPTRFKIADRITAAFGYAHIYVPVEERARLQRRLQVE